MPQALLIALTASGGAAALLWLLTLLDPARAWTLQPVGEDGEPARSPAAWPSVAIVVPARNEAAVLRRRCRRCSRRTTRGGGASCS